MKKVLKALLCLLAAVTVTILPSCRSGNPAELETDRNPPAAQSTEQEQLVNNPVDFDSLHAINEEIYAFINVPGTNVSYPILQSSESDNYYLRRDVNREYEYRGSLFTQHHNCLDFSDSITVIYGHNTDQGDFFSELLKFKDEEFFENNSVFYIYTPGHILEYKIISAHVYDNSHIMNTHDFTDPAVLQGFRQMLLNPGREIQNVRSGVTLDADSKVVILSTCAEAKSGGDTRYLVNGVLVSDTKTY